MDYSILLTQGISQDDCSSLEVINDEYDTYIFIKLKANQRICPHCGVVGSKIKEYKSKTVRSLPTGKNRTTIVYSVPRYICPCCGKTYTHNLNKYSYNSISSVLKKKLLEQFGKMISYKTIAEEYNYSTQEILEIFDKIVPNVKHPMTDAICIDEFSNVRKDDQKFACVLLDFVSHEVIDILPSRTTPYLDDYFSKIPLKTREKVKYIITDMYDGYISAAKKWFKNATIAIDPFHYMNYITDAVQDVRRRVFEDENNHFSDRSWMGSHWRLLTTNPKNYPEKNMTLKSGMTISYPDRIMRFVRQNHELLVSYLELVNIYYDLERLTFSKARSYFEMTINSLLNSPIPELVACGETWNHYKDYIINSFIVHKGKRLSNGAIEGFNKRVKELKGIMSGYRDKERFYKRITWIYNMKKGRH